MFSFGTLAPEVMRKAYVSKQWLFRGGVGHPPPGAGGGPMAKRKGNYLEGRLGLIIDGTGREFDKIQSQARQLQELGYDTYMIFVNTSLDVALQRNAERPRSVPESIVIKSWKDVQANLGKFNNFFGSGMIIVDNNDAGEDIFTQVFKRVQKLVKRKVQNTRAKNWIAMELSKKRR